MLTLLLSSKDDNLSKDDCKQILTSADCQVQHGSIDNLSGLSPDVDAIIIQSLFPSTSLSKEQMKILLHFPLLWYWEGASPDISPEETHHFDGLLFPNMPSESVRLTLNNSLRNHRHRILLQKDNDKLAYQLEERRWVDRAKSILREERNITEQEAYTFLRKQAMDERRRLPEVAASLVQFHKMLEKPREAEHIRG
ncbi:ANTAR domain-containing response regulator [Marininema mesophilum]|uniref:ANTAR domain-containing response regulator n=1 Tax=Marininema mesophilum TaxID=1048340 RepID=UPI00115FC981|nr:ANTAR domain-containing protein [Marininema mesophilum]